MADVLGVCEERFAAVRSLLQQNLDSGAELGASLVVDIDGELAVDLWGGFRDQAVPRRGRRTPSSTSGPPPRP